MESNSKPVSYLEAKHIVLSELGLRPSEAHFLSHKLEGDHYVMDFCTDWVKYEAYVSAETGELLGLHHEPK